MWGIEKWWNLLYVILNRSEGERKKESKSETYKHVAVKRKERKMAPVDRYTVHVLKWLTGHNVNFHLDFEFIFYEWIW